MFNETTTKGKGTVTPKSLIVFIRVDDEERPCLISGKQPLITPGGGKRQCSVCSANIEHTKNAAMTQCVYPNCESCADQ